MYNDMFVDMFVGMKESCFIIFSMSHHGMVTLYVMFEGVARGGDTGVLD